MVPDQRCTASRCTASGTQGIGRRAFLALLFGLLGPVGLWSAAALAQNAPHRVGVLYPAGSDTPTARKLMHTLAQRGFVEGRDIVYDVRAAGRQPDQLPRLARELVATRPAVIVSATTSAARALVEATRDIPIVLALVGDPVALGFTTSMARPSGNVTGFTTGNDTVAAKRLELLREMVPAARKIALMWVATNDQHRVVVERTRLAAAKLNIELLSLPVATDADIPRAIVRAEAERAGALLVTADPLTLRNRRAIIDQCLLRDLPAMHNYSVEVRDGALMAYGSDVGEDYGRAALYVERILKGAKVADLPFQEPTTIGLTINLRTARAIGLTVPPSLVARADEVIE
jgi:putative ABC transport system substrate-binding protein